MPKPHTVVSNHSTVQSYNIVVPPLIPLEDLLTREAFKKISNLCPYFGKYWLQNMVKHVQANVC